MQSFFKVAVDELDPWSKPLTTWGLIRMKSTNRSIRFVTTRSVSLSAPAGASRPTLESGHMVAVSEPPTCDACGNSLSTRRLDWSQHFDWDAADEMAAEAAFPQPTDMPSVCKVGELAERAARFFQRVHGGIEPAH